MTKTKPTAKEVILQLKTTIKNLEAQLSAATGGSVARTLQTQDLLERCQVLRSHLAHSDTAFTNANIQIAELEADNRQLHHEKVQANAEYFAEIKRVKADNKKNLYRIALIDAGLLILLAVLLW